MPRRRLRLLLVARGPVALVALTLVAFLVLSSVAAGAATKPLSSGRRGIEVIQVNGLIDPPNAALIRDSIRQANARRSSLLVIKVASGGSVDVNPDPLVRAIRRSRVPVAVWVGPSGGKAKGVAALLAAAAPVAAVSNGSTIGPGFPLRLDDPSATPSGRVGARMAALNRANGRRAAGGAAMSGRKLSSSQAVALGATNRVCPDAALPGCPTLGDLIVNLDGKTVLTAAGPVKLSTAKIIGSGKGRTRRPNQVLRFRKLDLPGQAVHTLTSPSVAYLLLLVGLALIIFEFFTISIGLAAATGAIALVGAFVGFSHLPVAAWAVLVILFAMFGYAIDVQAGRAYAWTVIATIALVIGSLFLYGGSARLNLPWWVLVLMIVGTVVFMVGAMPVAVRSRFSTPTIGREALIGEMGEAAVDVAPDGVVVVRDARWRARTNRATPIRAGEAIRVIEVDGLVLEVEPEAGGARDYREPRRTGGSVAETGDSDGS